MRNLNILVCLRQVPDPNGCRPDFLVDSKTKQIVLAGIPPVINPFDENALEAAIQLKERHEGKVTAIAVGGLLSKAVMLKALAMGADDLILYEDKGFTKMDTRSMAFGLSRAIEQRIDAFDIIMTGLQTSDFGFGLLGAYLADFLKIPFIGAAQKVSVDDTHIVVKRATRNGHQILKAAMPAVVTTDSLVGEPRYPSLKALVNAKKRSLEKWNLEDFEINNTSEGIERLSFEIDVPPDRKRKCVMIDGATDEEKARNLAAKLDLNGIFQK